MRVLSLDLEPRTDLPPFQGPRWLPAGVFCRSVRVFAEEIPASSAPFSHVLLSGSTCSVVDEQPFEGAVAALIRDAVRRRRPLFGVCYGHQLIVKVLLGAAHVRRARRPEMGWLPIETLPRGREVLAGLPDPFFTFVCHYDEVCDLPAGWDVLARTDECAVQAYVNEELRVLGCQFHPEMDVGVGNTCFTITREGVAAAGFDPDRIVSAARDDGAGRVLFPRFLEYRWPERAARPG